MSHLKFFGLNNFKVFKDQTDFELRPLTILTGTNSSGKSSFIKGLKLSLAIFNEKARSSSPGLSFLREVKLSQISSIGSFEAAKNSFSDKGTIGLRLPFALPYQLEEMILELSYISDGKTNDNAELSRIEVFQKKDRVQLLKFSRTEIGLKHALKDHWKCELNIKTLRNLKWEYIKTLIEYKRLSKMIVEENNIDKSQFIEGDPYFPPQGPESLEDLYYSDQKHKEILQALFDFSPKLFHWHLIYNGISKSSFKNPAFGLNFKSVKFDLLWKHFILPYTFLFNESELSEYINSNKELSTKNVEELLDFIKLFDTSKDRMQLFSDLQSSETDFMAECFKLVEPEEVEDEDGIEFTYVIEPVSRYMDIFSNGEGIGNSYNQDYSMFLGGEPLKDRVYRFFPTSVRDRYNLNSETILNHTEFKKYKINENSLVFNDSLKLKSGRGPFDPLKHFFHEYLRGGIDDSINLLSTLFKNIHFIPNIRSLQNRVIGAGESDYLGQLINEFHDTQIPGKSEAFLKKWVLGFEIADDVEIVYYKESLTSILYLKKDGMRRNIIDVGYGMSQLLPILLRMSLIIARGNKPSVLVIEEPETNLHPKLQSKLADLFAECYALYNIQLIIETHSEYLIRKLQFLTAKKELSKDDSIIYYFNNPQSEAYEQEPVFPIRMDDNGTLSRSFGPGFFDEAENIAVELFLLRNEQKN